MPISYVDYGGTQMLRPPYLAKNVSFYAFVVKADVGALQKIVDDRLNLPSGGAVHFEVAGPFVIIAFNNLEKLSSANPPDSGKGWFSEQECAVWVRVVDRKNQRSMWFHPYIFVDNSYAMALGREIYGFPKAIGWFEIPDEPRTATELFMETLTLPVFSPNTQGVRKRLISATQKAALANPAVIVDNAAAFLAQALGLLAAEPGALGDIEVIENSLHDLIERNEPIVFLKQLPMPGVPGMASFQSIVEMTATATALHGACVVPGEWWIDIALAASHPIASDLGLPGNSIKAALALWVGFDMIVGLGKDVWVAPSAALQPAKPQKIAILGGGVGAMATALELTSAADWKSRYDITIYQMGWRLGGKGASGRGENGRIEEHGLHIWLGFYENAFRVMRQVYEENKRNRPEGTPLRNWDEAFKTHSFIAITDQAGPAAPWEVWPINFPSAGGVPGDGARLTIWDMFLRLVDLVKEVYADSAFHKSGDHSGAFRIGLLDLRGCFGHLVPMLVTLTDLSLLGHLEIALRIGRTLDRDARKHSPRMHTELAELLKSFRSLLRDRIWGPIASGDTGARRLFQAVDLGVSLAIGLLRDGYLANPALLDTLAGDLQMWLASQGADPITYDVKRSAIMRALYDLVFAYENGNTDSPSFDAGPAIRSMLLIVGGYKGTIFWKMQAGMGDVVFGPMFEVLKSRGVKFEFFHRVEGLDLNEAGTSIDAIRIGVQATLKDPAKGYDPLIVCDSLPCWPNAPRYQQLVEGEQLKAGGYNLESFWTPWNNPREKVLRAGQEFDHVVLAISIGALPYLFDTAARLPPAFELMLSKIQTVRTQAMQLWVNQPLEELGWLGESVVLDAFSDPINTWAVMNQLLVREDWPAGTVAGLHYFCGQMAGGIPAQGDSEAPARGLSEVEANCDAFIQQDLPVLWPQMNNPEFKIVARFLRCNIDPSERYVLSVAGSTQYRLRANESGLSNVVLAGDWTNNGFNAGCVEAAVMSGIQAANAIQGNSLDQGIDGPLERELQAVGASG
jgi:uncharacterized protein with NAD-binding domain and iron-sulfur cluster/acetoacetate decarboxylase